MTLDGKRRRKLRALGHHLAAGVQVGQEGVTAGVLAALEQALWGLGRTVLLYKANPDEPRIAI